MCGEPARNGTDLFLMLADHLFSCELVDYSSRKIASLFGIKWALFLFRDGRSPLLGMLYHDTIVYKSVAEQLH